MFRTSLLQALFKIFVFFFSLFDTLGRKYSMSLIKKITEVMGVCVQRGKGIENKIEKPQKSVSRD